MPFHDWSDENFDWNSLYKAITECMDIWRRYGRIGTHGKEKYGTFRDQLYPWDGTIWSLFYPGYCHIQPKWRGFYFNIDTPIVQKLMEHSGLLTLGLKWQAAVYNYAVQRVCKKYPHIIDEIVADLDGYEWVKPGIFGPIDGTAIHKKYWTSFGEDE